MVSGKAPVIAKGKPIRSESELDWALKEFCALAGDASSIARLDELADVIEQYEEQHHPVPEPSHAALLQHLLPPRTDGLITLAKATGLKPAEVKAIVEGRRQIEPSEVLAFANFFSVDSSVFEPQSDEIQMAGKPGVLGRHFYGYFLVTKRSTAKASEFKSAPRGKAIDAKRVTVQQRHASRAVNRFAGLKS